MIAPTLAAAIDALVIEADVYVDPYQNGEDERACYCDTAICTCAVPLNGIVIAASRFVDRTPASLIADDPFGVELFSDDPMPF